jgi:hypothetical protein
MEKNKTFFEKFKERRLQQTKQTVKKENVTSGCSHSYGYLAVRAKNVPIPQECLLCPQLIDCILKTK